MAVKWSSNDSMEWSWDPRKNGDDVWRIREMKVEETVIFINSWFAAWRVFLYCIHDRVSNLAKGCVAVCFSLSFQIDRPSFNQRDLWRSYGPIITATVFRNLQPFQTLSKPLEYVQRRCWCISLSWLWWDIDSLSYFAVIGYPVVALLSNSNVWRVHAHCLTASLRLGNWLMICIDWGDDWPIDEGMICDLITYQSWGLIWIL